MVRCRPPHTHGGAVKFRIVCETPSGSRRLVRDVSNGLDFGDFIVALRAYMRTVAEDNRGRCAGFNVTMHPPDCDAHET
jgi:hypothetical protein